MIPLDLLLEIRRLLDDGRLSRRQISARLRVSRGMVSLVANGRRALANREMPAKRRRRRRRVLPPMPTRRIAVRCTGCGGRVYAPCLLCAIRAQRRDQWRRSSRVAARAMTPAARPSPAAWTITKAQSTEFL